MYIMWCLKIIYSKLNRYLHNVIFRYMNCEITQDRLVVIATSLAY